MGKLFKKSLAFCVAIVMVFTLFAGAISVNAETEETLTVTLEVTDTEITEDATEVVLPLAVTCSGDTSINAIRLVITTTAGTVTNVASAAATEDYTLYYNGQYALLNAPDLTGFNTANLLVTVALNADLTEEAYGITIDCRSDNAADANENALKMSYETGYILLPFNHVHAYSDTYTYDENNHWKTCDCGDKAEEAAHVWENDGEPVYADCVTPGTQAKKCVCGATTTVEVAAKGHDFVDGKCECGETETVACDHAGAVATVKTQPTKDAKGVMTYTCACGETWEEDIAIPTVSTVYTKLTISIEAVVGPVIDVSYKQVKANYGDDATYFLSIDHEKFDMDLANVYMKYDTNTVLPMSNTSTAITDNLHKHIFSELALYEMTLEFNPVVYIMNGDGVVIAYKDLGVTTIADMVNNDAKAGKATGVLAPLYADMCNYGAALQTYFAGKYPGTDICTQVLPTTIYKDYMSSASDPATMPETSFYNTTRNANKKVVSTTGFVSASPIMNVAASNEIAYTVRYDYYDWSDVEITVSYEDSLYGDAKNVTVSQSDLVPDGVASGNGQPKYRYFFQNLSIYDYNKTVTMNMYYKGNLECYTEYSLGYYIASNLSDASMRDILTTMVLFANSTRAAVIK